MTSSDFSASVDRSDWSALSETRAHRRPSKHVRQRALVRSARLWPFVSLDDNKRALTNPRAARPGSRSHENRRRPNYNGRPTPGFDPVRRLAPRRLPSPSFRCCHASEFHLAETCRTRFSRGGSRPENANEVFAGRKGRGRGSCRKNSSKKCFFVALLSRFRVFSNDSSTTQSLSNLK